MVAIAVGIGLACLLFVGVLMGVARLMAGPESPKERRQRLWGDEDED